MSVPILIEKIFVVLSLLYFTEPSSLFQAVAGSESRIYLVRYVLLLAINAASILLITIWWRRILRVAIKEKLLWLLVAITVISFFWSAAPAWTLRNIIFFLQTTLFGVYFSTRYSSNEQLRLLAWALGIGGLLSVVFALALPSYGIMGMGSILTQEQLTHAGKWRGIYVHKNPLGRIMALSGTVFLLIATSNRRFSLVAWAGCVLSVGLVLISTSKTALLIFLIIAILLPFYKALRWNNTLVVPFFITVILVSGSVAVLFVGNAETILGVLGRDFTLSGRTDLWAAILDKIWERPWLGYGYRGFWRGFDGESASIWSVFTWQPPHSHNGLLDVWIELGLLGLSTFVLSFLMLYLRAITWIRMTKTGEGFFPILYLTFVLLSNLSESSLMKDNIFWVLYVAVTFSMHNKSLNFAEPKTLLQPEVTEEAMKQISPDSQGGTA